MNPASDIIDSFRILHFTWFAQLWNYAHALFLSLIVIEVVIVSARSLTQGRGLGDLFDGLLWRLVTLGFFYAILMNADTWLSSIIQFFMTAGATAAQVPSLSPDEVLYQGLGVGLKMLWQLMSWGQITNIAGLFAGLIAVFMVIFSYLVIAVQMAVTLIRSYLLLGGGVIMLGLSGWSGSAHLSERYMWTLAGCGVQLMFLYLLVGAGGNLAVAWAELINDANSWDYKVPLLVGAGAVLYAAVCVNISSMVGGLISGGGGASFYETMRATTLANQTTHMAHNMVSQLAMKSASGGNNTTSVQNAARSSGGAIGGGGGASHGPVPMPNSTPQGSRSNR